jgi:hypothetical protein
VFERAKTVYALDRAANVMEVSGQLRAQAVLVEEKMRMSSYNLEMNHLSIYRITWLTYAKGVQMFLDRIECHFSESLFPVFDLVPFRVPSLLTLAINVASCSFHFPSHKGQE